MSKRIDLGGAHIPEEAIEAAVAVLRSGWPGPGPVADQFEQAFSEYIGVDHAVAVSSGSAALQIAIRLLNLERGREVITTANTFVATNEMILHEGLVPVFADIDPRTGNIDPHSIAGHVTDRTGAIMIVHYGGYPCDLDAIYAIADRHGLQVVEDCAHAAGASYNNRKIGSHAGLQAFSFQATKNLSAVDGGLLFARSKEEAGRAQRLRWMGIDSSTYSRTTGNSVANAYVVEELGYRSAMSDLNAAIALVQLEALDAGNSMRRSIAIRYDAAFSAMPGIQILQHETGRESSHHLYGILCEHRGQLAEELRLKAIITGNHYQRNDLYPIFESGNLPSAQLFSDKILTLPIHLGLSDSDVTRVIESVTDSVMRIQASSE